MNQARFIEAAAEMLGAAMVYAPEGMMQVGADFAKLPEALDNCAEAMKKMAQRAHDEDPIHPAIIDQMNSVYSAVKQAADLARELGPQFRTLHKTDVERVERPRRGEQRWDVSSNRDHVGRG